MHRRDLVTGAAAGALGLATPRLVRAQSGRTEVQFWYGLAGALGERVQEQVRRFNESQSQYAVVATFKGSYTDVMTGAIAAWRAGNPPHIAQVFEVGTATMMAATQAIRPMHQLMAEAGIPIDPATYIPGVRSYYSDREGRLVSMPHNSSSAIMWLNLDAFQRAGLSTTALPTTWAQIRAAAERLKAANATPVPMTTSWPTWVLFEQMGSMHNVLLASEENGFAGLGAQMNLTDPFFRQDVEFVLGLQRDGLFRYGGRDNAADALFPTGEAAISCMSSALRARVSSEARFRWAAVPLPYFDTVTREPRNGVLGGASLWTLTARNRTAAEYKAVAEFYRFISQPEQDMWWHEATGYVPITVGGYERARAAGYYERNPGADAAIIQLNRTQPTPASRGFRLGGFVEIRNIIQEELEKGFQGQQNAQQILETANRRGDQVLRNFERTNRPR